MFPKQKYSSKKSEANGILFHSTLEARRYLQLLKLAEMGQISDLTLQPSFLLQDKYYIVKNGKRECVRKLTYSADFSYMENGKLVIEDTKGFETKEYIIKRKLFLMMCDFDIFREYKSSKRVYDYIKTEDCL